MNKKLMMIAIGVGVVVGLFAAIVLPWGFPQMRIKTEDFPKWPPVLELESFSYSNENGIFEINSERIVTFYGENGEVVGMLDFGQEPLEFTGNATESTQIFMKALIAQQKDLCACEKP